MEHSVTTDESMKLTISCKKNVFDIEHLEFQYLENVPVLQDINLTIDHRPTAIIGQNGAGKTTLVKLLKGLLKPMGGSIYYGGSDMAEKTVAMLAGEICKHFLFCAICEHFSVRHNDHTLETLCHKIHIV